MKARYEGPADDEKPPPTPATLPRLNRRSKSTTYFRRPSLATFHSNSTSNSGGSLRTPDRFVPRRRPALDSAIQSFRANKEPKALSAEEKLLRHKDVSPDAFNPRRRLSPPIPQANRPIARRNYSGRRSGSGGIALELSQMETLEAWWTNFSLGGSVLAFQRDPAGPDGSRQVRVHRVWFLPHPHCGALHFQQAAPDPDIAPP
jgi:meiosis-specific APC/C activator protein AMA1